MLPKVLLRRGFHGFFERLRKGGVNVLEFNPVNPLKAARGWRLNNRNHRKITVVDGREVLVYQALSQFRWMTGREMPLATALRIVGLGENTP